MGVQLIHSLINTFSTMSVQHHESILETIYEELIAELTDTGDIDMMNSDDIEFAVQQRFQEMCI